MRFTPSFLDELRTRVPVSEVVGRKVKLKKQGREWRGLSPFKAERTPSFFVNDQKGFYHDFSSGKHGDIFAFLMETEGLTFSEAVEQIASMAGVSVPAKSPDEDAHEIRRKTLYDILELASKFFESTLASRNGAKARGYLTDRGIDPTTQIEFRLGYAPPERFALKEHLGAHGVSTEDMVEAGLLISGDDIPVPYDRFRDRVIIPIQDQRGRVIAFGGRTLRDDVQPKYLNSPETSLFHKGSIVFNFHRARQPAHDDGSVVVVEGYMDAISIYQAGLQSVVATMGTAFTEDQINALWRLSTEPIVCFDGDSAGLAASHRSLDRILPALRVGRTFKFAFLPAEKDPDELVRTKGLEALKRVLEDAKPLWDVLREREVDPEKAKTPDARAALEQRMYSIIRTIADPVVQTAYYRTCRIELSEFFWKITKGYAGALKKQGLAREELRIPTEGYRQGLQEVLMGLIVHYPEFMEDKYDSIMKINLRVDLKIFCDALHTLLVDLGEISVELIYDKLPEEFYPTLDQVHGDKSGQKPRGHRLFARFRVVQFDPPEQFVSDCIDHFVETLLVEQIREEIDRLHIELRNEYSEAILARIPELVRDWQLRRERLNNRDVALAEEAKEIKRLGRREDFRVAA
jgi:DNA primase